MNVFHCIILFIDRVHQIDQKEQRVKLKENIRQMKL
jgi:hypothetical protein